jgi:zinc and cadmium transporter
MPVIAYIIVFTLIGSIGALIGGVVLLYREKLALRTSHYLAAFAAGTLLGGAFIDLLPEAIEYAHEIGSDSHFLFLWVLGGIILFFLLERFIHWFHHSHTQEANKKTKPTVALLIFGDTMHNFIDGIVIGATFLVSIPLGIVTTLAVAAHEIPQEIGDFGIMLKNGMRRKNIIFINILSALISIIGAVISYSVGGEIEHLLPVFLAVTGGFFIYIALADLIPEIHQEHNKGKAYGETGMVILGILLIYFLVSFLEH